MNLPAAMQGLVVFRSSRVRREGRRGAAVKYDITGGRYEETNYDAQGSGSKDARDSLKKLWKRDMARDEALRVPLEALIDAADETSDRRSRPGSWIFPSVKTITRSGFGDVAEDEVRRVCEEILTNEPHRNGALTPCRCPTT